MTTRIDPDLYGSDALGNVLGSISGPLAAGASATPISPNPQGRLVVDWTARRPVVVVSLKKALSTDSVTITATLDPDGAARQIPAATFATYSEQGATLALYAPARGEKSIEGAIDRPFAASGDAVTNSTNQNWTDQHLRLVGDVGIVGFGNRGVWTALSNGDGTFRPARPVLDGFGVNLGWRVDRHPRLLVDLTGDGRADIVGFGDDGVWTALSNGDGTFQPARRRVTAGGVPDSERAETATLTRVTVVGDRWFGPVRAGLGHTLCELAQAAGCTTLETLLDADVVIHVSAWPDVAAADVADALADLLDGVR